tara:strand:+ start:75 stop:566 length:492 start_codon:yes stop_codon:yes gene_type:complete
LKFSENINNLFVLTIIGGLSFVFVFIIGQTNFAVQVELITFTPYSEKILLLTAFTCALLGNYLSIYKLWQNPDSKSIVFFAVIYSLLLLTTSVLLLLWLADMEALLDKSFQKLRFPNDVDEVIYKLRASFLNTIFWILLFFGSIGLISFFGILVLQKSGFKIL